MRKFVSFRVEDVVIFKKNLLNWASSFSKYCVLDSNQWDGNKNELIAGVGSLDEITPSENSFEELKRFHSIKKDWMFGHLSYDLKNETEKLVSKKFDEIGFPDIHFFQPEFVFILTPDASIGTDPAHSSGEGILKIEFLPGLSSAKDIETIFHEINSQSLCEKPFGSIDEIKPRVSEKEYIKTVNSVKEHIHRGDIYEMNYCMEFFSDEAEINPAEVFLRLSEASQAPFSAFYRLDDKYLMCASPERFLKKSGGKIISQPIKGTAKRGASVSEDREIKKELSQNEKEKSENVMIVDLVRNDLSRSCNNVTVDELFGVYTFKQWHQMISTISGDLREDVHFIDAIKNSFPMGSMTGAPKIRAMELIEQYEKTKRGLYSGAVGYLTPNPTPSGSPKGGEKGMGDDSGTVDFDFNVVIRSILYNQTSNYLSFQVGSAITANSIAENEYKECLLKAKGMFEALGISLKPLTINSYPLIGSSD